ncbi:hypothetical protein BV20DRAFT_573048 [Pilatotrama ljubarskyi]|nr:hypothetical protein BV20DRAFT_573048 [Pilatotrama ljubarskyi]
MRECVGSRASPCSRLTHRLATVARGGSTERERPEIPHHPLSGRGRMYAYAAALACVREMREEEVSSAVGRWPLVASHACGRRLGFAYSLRRSFIFCCLSSEVSGACAWGRSNESLGSRRLRDGETIGRQCRWALCACLANCGTAQLHSESVPCIRQLAYRRSKTINDHLTTSRIEPTDLVR